MALTNKQFLTECDQHIEEFANRGGFSSFGKSESNSYRSTYRFKWHLDREFELIANARTQKLVFPCILPLVGKKSAIDSDLRRYVKSLTGPDVLEHRRLANDPKNAKVENRNGSLSVSLALEDENIKQLVTRTIGLAHQIYTVFLRKGGYDEYLMETLNVDLDNYM